VSGFAWVESGSVRTHIRVAGDKPDKGGGGGAGFSSGADDDGRGFPQGGGGVWESEVGLGLSDGSVPLSLPFRDGELFSRDGELFSSGLLEGYRVRLSVVGKKGCCGIVARESDAAFDSRDR
jgi:hypothetical protein